MVERQERGDVEVELSCWVATRCQRVVRIRHGAAAPERCLRPRDVPRGPVTVTVLLGVCLYVVKSLTMYGSPMLSSTPGGMEIGVRPSFEGLAVDAENCRLAAGAGAQFWKAGTRKEGSVTTDEGATALALLGASIGGLATGCGGGRLHGAPVALDEAERDSGPWALSSKIAAGCLRKQVGTTRGLDCLDRHCAVIR